MPIIIFLFGLIIGSFLSAVLHRLNSGQSIISDRSRCPHCGHILSWYDLIPLFGFILQKGRCRYCGKVISWQYPLLELITGTSFVLLASSFMFQVSSLIFWLGLFYISILIVIAFYDFRHYLILDKVLLTGVVVSLIANFYEGTLVSGLIAAAIASGFFGLQYLLSRGRWIGLGDVKFGVLLGLVAGYPLILALLFLSYITGGLVGIGLLASGRAKLASRLPFGTFLAFSAIIILLYGPQIIERYRWFFGLY